SELETLRAQVDVYGQFKKLLDDTRFACWFGSKKEKEQGRKQSRELLALYDEIDRKTDRGAAGWPPLNAEQQQLLKEDAFEAFLVAALVEQDLAADAGEAVRKNAARHAVDWLNRAERILPDTRVLYVKRARCWGTLGDRAADAADTRRAGVIAPTSAVDHFWHGYDNHERGDEARARNDAKSAQEYYRMEIAAYAAFLRLRPDQFWGYF